MWEWQKLPFVLEPGDLALAGDLAVFEGAGDLASFLDPGDFTSLILLGTPFFLKK